MVKRFDYEKYIEIRDGVEGISCPDHGFLNNLAWFWFKAMPFSMIALWRSRHQIRAMEFRNKVEREVHRRHLAKECECFNKPGSLSQAEIDEVMRGSEQRQADFRVH